MECLSNLLESERTHERLRQELIDQHRELKKVFPSMFDAEKEKKYLNEPLVDQYRKLEDDPIQLDSPAEIRESLEIHSTLKEPIWQNSGEPKVDRIQIYDELLSK